MRISFSPCRSGLIASLEKGSNCITLYDIQESTYKSQHSTTIRLSDESLYGPECMTNYEDGTLARSVASGNLVASSGAIACSNGTSINDRNNNNVGIPSLTTNKSNEEIDIPILWKARKTHRLPQTISSFSWIPTYSTPSSHRFISVNKDSVYDVVTLEEAPHFSWNPNGGIAIFDFNGLKTFDVELETLGYNASDDSSDKYHQNNTDIYNDIKTQNKKHSNGDIGHKLRISLDLKYDSFDSGNRTPRPGDVHQSKEAGLSKKQLRGIALNQHRTINEDSNIINNNDANDLLQPLILLQEDISVLMRKRAKQSYSMECQKNENLVHNSPKLKSLWNWIAHAEQLSSSGKASIGTIDFSFQGVYSVWTASMTNAKKVSPVSTPKTSSPILAPEKLEQSINDSNEIAIVSTTKLLQRKLGLAICGWDFGKTELEYTLQRVEQSGNYEKAAAWALFHGMNDRAIAALNNSQDEHLRLVSTALVVYTLNNHDQSKQTNHTLHEICRNLSLEMREPYLRAIFSYISSGHIIDVLQEEGLALNDRIGIALRFLDDEKLNTYLRDITKKVINTGDIDGVILTGLTCDGVALFENYICNTGDVQTASLAMSFRVPRNLKDDRVIDWIENYRLLLDKWQMFHCRALFDIARGKYMASTTTSAAENVPPQVYVRCTYCNQSITHNLWISNRSNRSNSRWITVSAPYTGPDSGMHAKLKATCCPGCRKPLPRCSICLLSLGTPTDSLKAAIAKIYQNGSSNDQPTGFDLWFTWCQSCRHGGHAIHMSQWFEKHGVCPVSECPCKCQYICNF